MAAYSHTNAKGVKYYLFYKDVTLRGGREQRIYFFAKTETHPSGTATDLPDGYEVTENPRNGFLTIRKKR
ncbi:MAG: hypothetical protein LBM73_01895 [Candidatus Nomurabacteria bacterium]|jgi:hypothetical protein|nr:hypothetical protein [Candidatus Nomurabacteria bacterium]